MAMARARMAISHSYNGIFQISVRRFAVGAEQKTHESSNGSYSSQQRHRELSLFHPCLSVTLFGFWWYRVSERHKVEKEREEARVRERKMLEESGVNRESCEARIAEIKQKIESGSASQLDRLDMEMHEMWLQLFTRGA